MDKLTLPHPTDLEYFLEVARSLNISRAAERIGISQPSLSLAVQRLEQSVGSELLVRSKKGVSLTPAGKTLLAGAKVLLEQWKELGAQAKRRHEDLAGSYVIGCHPSVALYTLSHFITPLLEQHTGLQIELQHGLSRHVTEQVISLRIDLGIVVNPTRHPDLVIQPLMEDDVTLWTGSQKTQLNDAKSTHSVLICDPDLLQTQELIKRFKAQEYKFNRVLPSSNLEVITALVAGGAGIGVLPTRVAQRLAVQGLKKVSGAPVFKDKIALVYRAESRRVPSFVRLVDFVGTRLKKNH